MRLTYYITLFSVRPQDVQQFLQSLAEVCVGQEFCDVSVRCEDGLLSSHSLLLSAGVTAVLLLLPVSQLRLSFQSVRCCTSS